ncbi:MAG: hypothetical protein P8N94_04865, partial [Gammaproteobacteria bacterium]|nr:hypothetical protein [Gammaproteobacteria bacterium]
SGTINNLLGSTQTILQLKTAETEAARKVLEGISGADLIDIDTDGYLNIRISGADSIAINQAMMENKIPVAELILKRASLAGLFREITSEDA